MDTQKTIYIAGPMTGIPEHNFPAFNEAAARLREEGWFVVNPAENFGGRTDLPRHEYMRLDIKMLADCEAIYLLPGWERSRGAMMEYKVALELELDVYGWARATPAENDSILTEAQNLVHGPRQHDYGHPIHDWTRTAAMWSALLDTTVTAEQAVMCMIAVKLSREVNRPKRDNRVDAAGYAEVLDMIVQRREQAAATVSPSMVSGPTKLM
ncbi:MAG: DUF4406 domain-containing protein [Acholeplasmataceae bacterium]